MLYHQLRSTIRSSWTFPRIRALRPRAINRRSYWLLLGSAALTYSVAPHPVSLLDLLHNSPDVIPCPCPHSTTRPSFVIASPAEPNLHFIISRFLNDILWEPLLTTARFIYLLCLFLPVIVSSPIVLVGSPEAALDGDTWGAVWWYELLVSTMASAGPTFIKLAQWAGSRADLFPRMLCKKLGTLHSNGRPHPFSHTRAVIESVFRRPFDECFDEFDDRPIGTGAIAQVYRAILKQGLLPLSYLDSRHRHSFLPPNLVPDPSPSVPEASVAIKVLHPNVHTTIARDLRIMSFFARMLTLLPGIQWLSLPEEVHVFGTMMFQQLDLRNEAENLLAFEKNFANRPVSVGFPRPLQEFSTHNVLVEEFQDALTLEDFLRLGGGPFDESLASLGLDAFLNMLLLDNFVHSDLHPGNILIRFSKPLTTSVVLKGLLSRVLRWPRIWEQDQTFADSSEDVHRIVHSLKSKRNDPMAWNASLDQLGSKGYFPEVIFIDAGLTTTLSVSNRRNFLDLFRAIAEFDGYRAGELMVSRCRTPELVKDAHTFALEMQHLVLSVKRKTFTLGQIRISDVLGEVLRSVRHHHVKMEADFVNTVISILLLEGIGRSLDPSLDLFKSALPILRHLGGQLAAGEVAEGTVNAAGRIKNLPRSNLGVLLKLLVWTEARSFVSSTTLSIDELIKYDWLAPNI